MDRTRLRWLASALMVVLALAAGAVEEGAGPALGRAAATPVPRYPPSWVRYAPAGGGFHVMAPGPPRERQGVTDVGVLHRSDFAAPDGGTWFVEWLEVSPWVSAGRSGADLIDLLLAPLADRLGARIEEEDILRQGSHPGVELHLVSSDGRTFLVRAFSVPGLLIEAAAVIPAGGSGAEAARFVGSLELDVP